MMIMNKEVFKDIPGYEGLYQISNFGKVKSLPRKENHFKEKVLTVRLDRGGYPVTFFRYKTKGKWIKIHRAIAMAFINNPLCKEVVNHIDGDKQNYNILNLEWVTDRENKDHAMTNRLYAAGEKNNGAKLKEEQVKEIRELYKTKKLTIRELSQKFDISWCSVQRITSYSNWKYIK